MIDEATLAHAETLLTACRARGWRIATAESCTGGLIAATLTAIPGSSDVVDRGFVTYSNAAKTDLVGVDAALIARVGAVSEEVVRAMAQGALARSAADLAIAVTGVAGPGGTKVGLVWFGLAARDWLVSQSVTFPGDRAAVRAGTVAYALEMMMRSAKQ